MELRVLFVDDSPDDVELMARRLRAGGMDVSYARVDTEDSLRRALDTGGWQIALVDHNLPDLDGVVALRLLARRAPDLPAITVSGSITEATAVETLSAGAVDYILKDNLARLGPAVTQAVEGADLRRRRRRDAEMARQSQFAIDHASQAIVYVSEDGRIMYVNHAAEAFGGPGARDAVGSDIWAWSPVAFTPEQWRTMWDRAASGPIVDLEAPVTLPDGRVAIVQSTLERLQHGEDAFMIVYSRDVTDQRAAEERALETEARYGRLTETLPDIIFRYDLVPEQRLTYINQAVETLTGYSPEECYADPRLMIDFAHPDDAGIMAAALTTVTVPTEPVVMRWVGKDGSVRWMESRIVPVTGAGGELLAVEGVTRDVTAILRTTEQLAHSRDLLDYVVAHARSAIAIHDRDRRYVYVSERYLKEYGVERQDIIGRHHYEVMPDLPQRWRDVHTRALAGEVSSAERDPWVHADGHVQWTRWECRPWYESDGSVGGFIVYTEDITEQVVGEEALRASEERFRRVSRVITDVAYSCVRDADGPFHFDWLSGAMESITGYSREDLLAWGCWKPLVVEEDVPVFERHVTGLAPGETGSCELRIRRPDGTVRWLASFAEMTAEAGEPSVHRLYGACQDITERKRVETALRESEERFKRFAERIPGLITMKDADHRYVYVHAPDEHGTPDQAAWLGKTPGELWSPAEAAHSDEVADRVLAGEVVEETAEWRRGDEPRYYRSLHFPIPSESGPPLVGGLSLDVTDEHEAQAEVVRHAERLRRTVEGAVLAMGHVVETRDPYTAGHERRVAELAVAIALELGLEPARLEGLRLAALIHDIGKIAVPAEILAKPGRLSEVEFNLIRQHARAGYEILAAIEFDAPVAEIVLQHHERLSGEGYPDGLAGEAVLFEARILAVADTVEAMSSHRPYRPALGMAAALEEVRAGAGRDYDPEVAAACLRVVVERGFEFTP